MTTIASLIQAVEAADSAMDLVKAMENLAATGQVEAIPMLIAALSYNNPGAAVAAVDGLIMIGEPAVEPILAQLDGHNYTARAWAIRALAGIGDPRGLVTLLGAATADFALSVRRAAAKGLGTMRWHWFPSDMLEIAQEEALEALSFVVLEDEEWVVRYSAVVGLQELWGAIDHQTLWQEQVHQILQQVAATDESWAVRARAIQAQLSEPKRTVSHELAAPAIDWQAILQNIYYRKGAERSQINEGDPRKFHELAGSMLNAPQ